MEIANGLTVVSSSLDTWVLKVLAQTTRPLSGRQVVKLSRRGSVNGVHRVLARLVDHGIVFADQHPSATLYSLNRDHLAAGPVLALAGIELALTQHLEDLMETWQVQPLHAVLFGSAARGDGSIHSDVDLLLVHAGGSAFDPVSWNEQLDELANKVQLWTGNRAAIMDVDAEDLSRMMDNEEPILGSWRRDAVVLAGEPLPRGAAGRR